MGKRDQAVGRFLGHVACLTDTPVLPVPHNVGIVRPHGPWRGAYSVWPPSRYDGHLLASPSTVLDSLHGT